MKICRFWLPGKGPRVGLVDDGRIFDLSALDPSRFGSFSGFICDPPASRDLGNCLSDATKQASILLSALDVTPEPGQAHLLPPITRQEVWGAGVTYLRSRDARMQESPDGGSFYDKVYDAVRPEIFFKATAGRVVGPNAPIRIRQDSRWTVPEPELALVIGSQGQVIGYTVGNDVSSRDIEGENPLYLPQAKIYMGCCALGPVVALEDGSNRIRGSHIELVIRREGRVCFEGVTGFDKLKRDFNELVAYLFREQDFPAGAILLTGTGIVPPDEFALRPGDLVEITVPEIGTLRNPAR